MKIGIGMIRVTERIRKEINKVDELAANIRAHGLISPIAVMRLDGGEYQLLAGLRRLRAMELNGETEIDAKVFSSINAEDALRFEHSENIQREPFTYSEKMDYSRLIEEIEAAKAIERKAAGGKGGLKEDVASGPHLEKGRRRDIVAAKIGMSGTQYRRAKYVADNAPPEMIEQLDHGETTIGQSYDKLRAEGKAIPDPEPAIPVTELESVPKAQPDAPKAVAPTQNPPARSRTGKKDPYLAKLEAQQAEAVSKRLEFDALSPEGKIEELQRQLKEARVRANSAEIDLAREKELRQNIEYHLGGTIELLKNQLASAEARIAELEGAAAREVSV